MVESVFVIMLLCLIFWGFLQAAILYNHERVLQFASFATARSATVGFQPALYLRSYRVAAIPASGTMVAPVDGRNTGAWTGANQQMQQLGVETLLIPLYLRQAPGGNLNYAYWDQYNMQPTILPGNPLTTTMLSEQHDQEHPLEMPMVGAYYRLNRGTNATITMMHDIRTDIASHCQYYLQ
jgi:hypothetical protein